MLRVISKLEELDFSQLMEIYIEGNEEHGRELWPELPYEEQLEKSRRDFYEYLQNRFFTKPGAVYAVWQEEGRYVSALRLEPNRDGLLLEALETLPEERRKGYATCLIREVQKWLGTGRLYSHVSKRNTASLATHSRCGFFRYLDYVETSDGTRRNNSVTLCAMAGITLKLYNGEKEEACALIQGFWKAHNDWFPTEEEALEDLTAWTSEGHRFYFVEHLGEKIGFVHLGSRGAEIDWLEDLFILPAYQGRGIGRCVIGLVEEIVKTYAESLYMEAAARNDRAIRLYHRIGYDCLNTVTLRKDFRPEEHETIREERLFDLPFTVRKRKDTDRQ